MITEADAEALRASIEAAMAGDLTRLPEALKVAEHLAYEVVPEWFWEHDVVRDGVLA